MSENIVHLFVAVVKPVPGFRDEVTGDEAVYESSADAPAEVLYRVLVRRSAVREHLLAGKLALQERAGAGRHGGEQGAGDQGRRQEQVPQRKRPMTHRMSASVHESWGPSYPVRQNPETVALCLGIHCNNCAPPLPCCINGT